MPPDFKAEASLKGIDDLSIPFSKGLRKAEKAAKRSFGRMEKLGLRARRAMAFAGQRQFNPGKPIRALGRTTSAVIGRMTKLAGAVGGVGALAINQFGKFELAVSRIGNLLDGDQDAVELFGDQLKRLSLQFGIPQVEAAAGAYQAFSGGVETSSEALAEFLPEAAKLAKAGNTDLATAVDALTSLKNVFADISTAEASDLIFITEKLGKTDPGQIASSIGSIAGLAKAAGVPLQEILAAMASITQEGKTTSEAFTQINAIMKGIRNPAKELQKNFKKLGVPFGPLALKQAGGLMNILQTIAETTEAGALQKLFGRRQEALAGATRLTQTGLKPMRETADALAESAGAAEKNWANMTRRTGFKVEQLKVGFSGLFTELGAGLVSGLGVTSADPEDIAKNFESAGKRIRSGAKNFAEGFITALVPAGDLSLMDFDSMAQSAGVAFGKMITGLGKLIGFAITAVEKIAAIGGAFIDLTSDIEGFIGGDTKVDKLQKELGLTEISTRAEQQRGGIAGDEGDLISKALNVGFNKFFGAGEQPVTGREQAGELARLAKGVSGKAVEINPLELFARAAERTTGNAAARAAINVITIEQILTLKGELAKIATVEKPKVKAKKGAVKPGKSGVRKVGT